MNPFRHSGLAAALVTALLAGTAIPIEASAQGFFERLFGIRPSQPMYPPGSIPQGPRPAPGPFHAPPGPDEGGLPPLQQPTAPPPPKPVVLRPPTEDAVVGQTLRLNGTDGNLRIERAGRDLRALITLAGAKISQETEACSVQLGGGQPLALTSLGKPEGLARYEAQAPGCPIQFDILDGAVLMTAPKEACVIQEADCRVEAAGIWGPEPSSLLPRSRDIEQARGSADRAVRENYKALTHRATPQQARPIVSEQAAFSAEREMVCRSYQREGAHGFCNARFTEGRAVTLASRLGLIAPTAEAQPERSERRARPPAPPRAASSPPPPGAEWNPNEIR